MIIQYFLLNNNYMYILITYDVNTETLSGQRRLRKVSKLCQNFGQRVQNSVFECVLTEVQLAELKNDLQSEIDGSLDSIRIYYLNKNENRRVITLGLNTAVDVEDSLII